MKFPLRHVAMVAIGVLGLFAIVAVPRSAATQELSPRSSHVSRSVSPANSTETIVLPGPLRPFLRMAGISQEVAPEEVLPLLARNVFLHGYEVGKPTEFLILLDRYMQFARTLETLASSDGVIRVGNCESADRLISLLGYRFEHGCSRSGATLTTQDAERAFIAVDSGFPITRLEQALESGEEFAFPFPKTQIPVLFRESDWIHLSVWKERTSGDLIDALLHDEQLDRLYSAMARIEPNTRAALVGTPGLARLLPYAPILDFYGGQLSVPDHVVAVPGGPKAEAAWQSIVGVSPHSPAEFIVRLIARDRGWLAAYYDAVARISPEQQNALLRGNRLKAFYEAYRPTESRPMAASGVFPRNSVLLLTLNRIPWNTDGQPDVPGNLEVWQQIFAREIKATANRVLGRHAEKFDNPDALVGAIVSAANAPLDDGPTQIYLSASAIDSRRAPGQKLSANVVNLLAARFDDFRQWYLVFVDFPELNDAAITEFVRTADHVNSVSGEPLRANALGAFQADLSIWQILARQKEIGTEKLDASWKSVLAPFAKVDSANSLFEASRASLIAAATAAGGSATPNEDEILDLLAGPDQKSAGGERVHDELAQRMRAVLDDQRLASLDTLFGLYDGMQALARGSGDGSSLLPLAQDLHDFEMPRPIFSEGERVAWSPVIYTSRHAELQVQTDLAKLLRSKTTPQQLDAARARLAPFLRDTLVGLIYAYYEPPGAQVLHNNPLFVRSHDFAVESVQGIDRPWDSPELVGVGATAGGGAYLMGSLAELPYALASAEEDFITPTNVQALIWHEAVPELLVGSVIPRWWSVSKSEMHAAALYQRAGEELLNAARENDQLRVKVNAILADRFTPTRLEAVEASLRQRGRRDPQFDQVLPADTFFLATQFRAQYPDEAGKWGPASSELNQLVRQNPADCEPQRIAADFGVPHPAFAETDTTSLLKREPFPVSGGYASRLFGESWESSNLYWARLADEMGYSPVMLNVLVPELTRHMVADIFATYVDDWPALLRAMQRTGDDFRNGKFAIRLASRDGANGEVADGSASE